MSYILSFAKILVFITLLTVLNACNSSHPDKLVTSFSNDLNNSFLVVNRYLQINVYENFDDGTQNNISQDLIWSSSDENLATVVGGLVTAKSSEGVVEISYKHKGQLSNGNSILDMTVSLPIKDLKLTSILLSTASISLSIGENTTVSALGILEDGSSIDVTNSAEWISADTGICSAEKGTLSGINEGNTTVVARDANITSNLAYVSVLRDYKSFSISSEKTDFNVEQSIAIEAKAINQDNEVIVFNSDDVIWSSSDENIVLIEASSGLAVAVAEGNATVTGTLKVDKSFVDSLDFRVLSGTYMRLFKNDIEISFPYASQDINLSIPAVLDTFTIKAIGKNYSISELKVTTLDGTIISESDAWFENLSDGDIILRDQNRTFELKHNQTQTELVYFFKINDTNTSEFNAKYLGIN